MSENHPNHIRTWRHLQLDLEQCARYHAKRAGFLGLTHKIIMFVLILSGTVAFSQSAIGLAFEPLIGILVTVLATLSLVFDYSSLSRDHKLFYKEAQTLLSECHAILEPSKEDVEKYQRLFHGSLIDANTSHYKALNALCHNEVLVANGMERARLKIDFLYRLFSQVFKFESVVFHTDKK